MKDMALQQLSDWMKARLDELEAMRDNEVTADAALAEVIDLFAMEVGEYESEDAILYLAPHANSYEAISPKAAPLLYKWLVGIMREETEAGL